MNITTSPLRSPQRLPLTPTHESDTGSSELSFSNSDRFDATEPLHVLSASVAFVAGSTPLMGTLLNGVQMGDADTKPQRWSSFAASGASLVGIPLMMSGIFTGSTGAAVTGGLLAAYAGGNLAFQHIENF